MNTYHLSVKDAESTGEFITVKSPFSGNVFAQVEMADNAAVEKALANAHQSFAESMSLMPAHRRASVLYEVSRLIQENQEDLARTIAVEGGKPLKDARVEVARAVNTTKMAGDEALILNGRTISMDRAPGSENCLAYTVRVPVGPVLAICAFNHPVNLICHQVCTALAAGNSIVVKPASQTPVSCLKIAEFFRKAGLPEGIINVLTISGSQMDRVVSDPRIRFVTFIGGEDVGWEIRKKVQPGVRLALEHGGTGTVIVDQNADLDNALKQIVKGAYYHAGQVCVSVQLAYVHTGIFDEFIFRLKQEVEKLKTGDPLNPETDVGPLISACDVERVDGLIKDAINNGAELISGGTILEGNCYAPTLLSEVNPSMRVIRDEVFGPVLSLRRYDDVNTVVGEMNRSRYSFQSALFTRDLNLAHSLARKVECKAFMVNSSTAFRVDWMPFGGLKASGLGAGGTRDALYEMTEERLVVLNVLE